SDVGDSGDLDRGVTVDADRARAARGANRCQFHEVSLGSGVRAAAARTGDTYVVIPAAELHDDPVARILTRVPAHGGPHIVGIDGPAGSGKSTLAADLAAVTGAPVVGI